jgi:predicted negative regulator of RcsB-dependent stress response
MYPTRCISLVATGELDEAERLIEANLEATRRATMPHWEALTLNARGQLHLARGDVEAARQDYDAAIAIFRDLGSRLELERTEALRSKVSD